MALGPHQMLDVMMSGDPANCNNYRGGLMRGSPLLPSIWVVPKVGT